MTLPYRDSSFDRPNAAQAATAFAAGVRVWGGYIAAVVPPGLRSAGGSNLATAWTQQDFAVVQAAGIAAVGFCSGWDDATACGTLARAWGVIPMLDCEDGIRGDGPWVDPWLAASGAGLYGLCAVHWHAAPWHIVARYPGVTVPASTWDPLCPRPTGLLGWQAEGTHRDPATGLQVDGGWVDDGFAVLAPPAPAREEDDMLMVTPVNPDGSVAPGFLLSGGLVADIPDQADTDALSAAGVQIVKVSSAFAAEIKAASAAFRGPAGPPGTSLAHDHPFTGTTGQGQGVGA